MQDILDVLFSLVKGKKTYDLAVKMVIQLKISFFGKRQAFREDENPLPNISEAPLMSKKKADSTI